MITNYFFALMAAILFGMGTFTSITGQAPYGVSKVAAIYCFTIVSAVVLVGTARQFMRQFIQQLPDYCASNDFSLAFGKNGTH